MKADQNKKSPTAHSWGFAIHEEGFFLRRFNLLFSLPLQELLQQVLLLQL